MSLQHYPYEEGTYHSTGTQGQVSQSLHTGAVKDGYYDVSVGGQGQQAFLTTYPGQAAMVSKPKSLIEAQMEAQTIMQAEAQMKSQTIWQGYNPASVNTQHSGASYQGVKPVPGSGLDQSSGKGLASPDVNVEGMSAVHGYSSPPVVTPMLSGASINPNTGRMVLGGTLNPGIQRYHPISGQSIMTPSVVIPTLGSGGHIMNTTLSGQQQAFNNTLYGMAASDRKEQSSVSHSQDVKKKDFVPFHLRVGNRTGSSGTSHRKSTNNDSSDGEEPSRGKNTSKKRSGVTEERITKNIWRNRDVEKHREELKHDIMAYLSTLPGKKELKRFFWLRLFNFTGKTMSPEHYGCTAFKCLFDLFLDILEKDGPCYKLREQEMSADLASQLAARADCLVDWTPEAIMTRTSKTFLSNQSQEINKMNKTEFQEWASGPKSKVPFPPPPSKDIYADGTFDRRVLEVLKVENGMCNFKKFFATYSSMYNGVHPRHPRNWKCVPPGVSFKENNLYLQGWEDCVSSTQTHRDPEQIAENRSRLKKDIVNFLNSCPSGKARTSRFFPELIIFTGRQITRAELGVCKLTNLFPYFTDVLTYDKMHVRLVDGGASRGYNDGRLQHCVVDSSQEIGGDFGEDTSNLFKQRMVSILQTRGKCSFKKFLTLYYEKHGKPLNHSVSVVKEMVRLHWSDVVTLQNDVLYLRDDHTMGETPTSTTRRSSVSKERSGSSSKDRDRDEDQGLGRVQEIDGVRGKDRCINRLRDRDRESYRSKTGDHHSPRRVGDRKSKESYHQRDSRDTDGRERLSREPEKKQKKRAKADDYFEDSVTCDPVMTSDLQPSCTDDFSRETTSDKPKFPSASSTSSSSSAHRDVVGSSNNRPGREVAVIKRDAQSSDGSFHSKDRERSGKDDESVWNRLGDHTTTQWPDERNSSESLHSTSMRMLERRITTVCHKETRVDQRRLDGSDRGSNSDLTKDIEAMRLEQEKIKLEQLKEELEYQRLKTQKLKEEAEKLGRENERDKEKERSFSSKRRPSTSVERERKIPRYEVDRGKDRHTQRRLDERRKEDRLRGDRVSRPGGSRLGEFGEAERRMREVKEERRRLTAGQEGRGETVEESDFDPRRCRRNHREDRITLREPEIRRRERRNMREKGTEALARDDAHLQETYEDPLEEPLYDEITEENVETFQPEGRRRRRHIEGRMEDLAENWGDGQIHEAWNERPFRIEEELFDSVQDFDISYEDDVRGNRHFDNEEERMIVLEDAGHDPDYRQEDHFEGRRRFSARDEYGINVRQENRREDRDRLEVRRENRIENRMHGRRAPREKERGRQRRSEERHDFYGGSQHEGSTAIADRLFQLTNTVPPGAYSDRGSSDRFEERELLLRRNERSQSRDERSRHDRSLSRGEMSLHYSKRDSQGNRNSQRGREYRQDDPRQSRHPPDHYDGDLRTDLRGAEDRQSQLVHTDGGLMLVQPGTMMTTETGQVVLIPQSGGPPLSPYSTHG